MQPATRLEKLAIFKNDGDWRFGRHFNPDVPIANAIAASAAVPYVIGALKFNLPEHGWWKTDPATKNL